MKLTVEPKSSLTKLAITSGDPDGIGTEVAAKALVELGPQKSHQFILWRGKTCPVSHFKNLDQVFERRTYGSYDEYLTDNRSCHPGHLIDICSPKSAAHWVVESAQLCIRDEVQALITGPLSKGLIKNNGFSEIGHTGLLKSISKTEDLFMGFLGSQFNVVLITDHIPLSEVPTWLSPTRLKRAIEITHRWCNQNPKVIASTKPLGLLGLNPHAGEEGLLGSEELGAFKDALNWAQTQQIPVTGPLVPDSAFHPSNWQQYSFYLCPYHDQGLIPFKMSHWGLGSVHITLGLPFLRLSVDHGTAKDIFNQDRASHLSMLSALQMAIHMTKTGKE